MPLMPGRAGGVNYDPKDPVYLGFVAFIKTRHDVAKEVAENLTAGKGKINTHVETLWDAYVCGARAGAKAAVKAITTMSATVEDYVAPV